MIAQQTQPILISRRRLLFTPLLLSLDVFAPERALASEVTRELVAQVERDEGLGPPLTLGIARVVLRPGVSALAATPSGARMIVVESGVLAVSSTSHNDETFTSAELAIFVPAPEDGDELFVPAGTTVTFGSMGVSQVRNPGGRSVVALDVAVFEEDPRPISRAFTTDDGISFQLLASANAAVAPGGPISLILERVQLGAQVPLPIDLSRGLTLMYIEAGAIELRPTVGDVYAARAAASTPYSMPGALQPITIGETRGITAGGVVYVPMGAESGVINLGPRSAEILALAVREAV